MKTDRILMTISITESMEHEIYYTATVIDNRSRLQRTWLTDPETNISDCLEQVIVKLN